MKELENIQLEDMGIARLTIERFNAVKENNLELAKAIDEEIKKKTELSNTREENI